MGYIYLDKWLRDGCSIYDILEKNNTLVTHILVDPFTKLLENYLYDEHAIKNGDPVRFRTSGDLGEIIVVYKGADIGYLNANLNNMIDSIEDKGVIYRKVVNLGGSLDTINGHLVMLNLKK